MLSMLFNAVILLDAFFISDTYVLYLHISIEIIIHNHFDYEISSICNRWQEAQRISLTIINIITGVKSAEKHGKSSFFS